MAKKKAAPKAKRRAKPAARKAKGKSRKKGARMAKSTKPRYAAVISTEADTGVRRGYWVTPAENGCATPYQKGFPPKSLSGKGTWTRVCEPVVVNQIDSQGMPAIRHEGVLFEVT